MKKIFRIGIIVDNPNRDLKGILLIANQLMNLNNIKIFLIPMYYQKLDVQILDLDILILNYARINNKSLIKEYVKNNIKLFVLDTEGGILSKNSLDSPENWAKLFFKEGFSSLISGYFFWGEVTYNAFKKFSGLAENKLHLTGCPRYDQAHQKWKTILNSKYSDHILINSNFSAINPLFSKTIDEEMNSFLSVGWDKEYINELITLLKKVHIEFIDEVEYFANRMPKNRFIFRPHPFENSKLYERRYISIKNLIVDPSGDIFDSVVNAKCVIHLNCGSSVDALMAGVPSISIEYLNNDILNLHTPLPSKISFKAKTREEVLGLIDKSNYIEASKLQKLYSDYVEEFFYLNDGRASERVSIAMHNFIKDHNKEFNNTNKRKYVYGKNSLLLKIQIFFAYLIGSKLVSSLRNILHPTRKNKGFTLNSVQYMLNKLNESNKINVRYARGGKFSMKFTSIEFFKEDY